MKTVNCDIIGVLEELERRMYKSSKKVLNAKDAKEREEMATFNEGLLTALKIVEECKFVFDAYIQEENEEAKGKEKDETDKENDYELEQEDNIMKNIYKIKFADKESKEEFVKYTDKDIFLKEKKKSVTVKAKNKDKVRDMIEDAERASYHYGEGYCFGEENEDYKIKKEPIEKEKEEDIDYDDGYDDDYEL